MASTALRQHRRDRDLTQEDLSELLGISQATISNWELGLTRPRRKSPAARKLEGIFGVPADALMRPTPQN